MHLHTILQMHTHNVTYAVKNVDKCCVILMEKNVIFFQKQGKWMVVYTLHDQNYVDTM